MTRLVAAAAVVLMLGAGARPSRRGDPVPPFPSSSPRNWIGAPVTWQGLRGKVVLLHVWTFG